MQIMVFVWKNIKLLNMEHGIFSEFKYRRNGLQFYGISAV